jgi:hypothetical protein
MANSLQGVSARISTESKSFTAGIGLNISGSRSKATSLDINGDGLNDLLYESGNTHHV